MRVEILPISIKLDYKPKYGFKICHIDGMSILQISRASKIGQLLQEIWTPDVKANQLEDVISGIGPVRSVVNLGTKIADLVLLPIEEMKKKDGHLSSGIQKGTSPFAKNTTLEVINPMTPFSRHSSSKREARPRLTYHCVGKMALSLQRHVDSLLS
ncbi:uncharacterized protein VP01_9291g1 [Puccinia sorghi]|uniref:Autophagy-related protein 2 n=1 Tax=Puccinia sorghi TaxID=27349 RepID=A0A0L6U958_9BASI|nr:uncharacterized protein VP01_9291g1 [Puccinia sorghi]